MKTTYLTLQQISERVLSELLLSRTDFLLLQAQVWKNINDAAKESGVFVQPNTLDLGRTTFEFCIARKIPNFTEKVINFFRKSDNKKPHFRLCDHQNKEGIKVTISICPQSEKECSPEIRTEPEMTSKPDETYVAGLDI
jgi:hypothetical protein